MTAGRNARPAVEDVPVPLSRTRIRVWLGLHHPVPAELPEPLAPCRQVDDAMKRVFYLGFRAVQERTAPTVTAVLLLMCRDTYGATGQSARSPGPPRARALRPG